MVLTQAHLMVMKHLSSVTTREPHRSALHPEKRDSEMWSNEVVSPTENWVGPIFCNNKEYSNGSADTHLPEFDT